MMRICLGIVGIARGGESRRECFRETSDKISSQPASKDLVFLPFEVGLYFGTI